MKIKRAESNHKLLIISLASIALLLLAYAAFAYTNSFWPFARPSASDEARMPTGKLDKNVAGQHNQNKAKGPSIAEEPTTPVGGDAKLTITQLAQKDNHVLVKASLENVSPGGRCIAYFNSEGGAVSKYMTLSDKDMVCSLDISALEFSYLGKWSVRVVYTTTDDKKIEAMGELVIK